VSDLSGVPSGATVSTSVPAAPNKTVVVMLPRGYSFSEPVAIGASFAGLGANAGAPQTVSTGNPVTLDGSQSTGAISSWLWTQTSGPGYPGTKVIADNSSGAKATFTPTVIGAYTFRLTITGGATSYTTVTVTADSTAAARTQCQDCHLANNVGVQAGVFGKWSSSQHRANFVMCSKCHVGADTGAHPGPGLTSSTLLNVCNGCHIGQSGTVNNHPFAIGTALCVTCHDPHSTVGTAAGITPVHFNNQTGAGYPASYMTSRASCTDCHFDSAENALVRAQWGASGHAATSDAPWTSYDFKTRSGCVQCHTTTGFIAYSTGKVTAAWGDASDKTKEVVTCIACHSDITTGTVRTVTPVRPFADDAYLNRNMGNSNVCMDCHSGRNNGNSIEVQVGVADFTNLPFVAPHYLAAGGSLHGKSGYHFPGQTYAFYSSNSHRGIGMFNASGTGTGGPCIGCHMSSAAPHSYQAAVRDTSGNLTAISSTVCAGCHASSLDLPTLAADQAAFANALSVLKAMLADKGFVYSLNYPYFNSTNWGSDQVGADAMGAAFNYELLLAEPGAYAHNGAYARKLITDSIDSLYNGSVTGSIDSALAHLVQIGAITQAVADSLTAYKATNNCTSCHANTSGSHTKHLSNSVGCVSCHSLTAASNTALIPGTQKHLNGVVDVNLAAGGSYGAGICSAVYCHSNGASTFVNPVWGGGPSDCNFCHPLASLRGAHAAHIGALVPTSYGDTGNYSTANEYRFGCANCHPTAVSSHGDGHIDLTLVPTADGSLRSKNNPSVVIGGIGNTGSGITGNSGSSVVCSAAYCHSNGGVGAALVYVNSPDWYAGHPAGDSCAMCHGNAPATGAHAKHAVSIHSTMVYDENNNPIPAAAAPAVSVHGDPNQATTISCNICHSLTVTSDANDNNSVCASCHSSDPKGTPVLNKTVHLNGSVDVVFQDIKVVSKAQIKPASFGKYSSVWTRSTYKVDAGSFDTAKLSLAQGVYNADKSCSNMACHNGAAPKWSDRLTCISCHSAL